MHNSEVVNTINRAHKYMKQVEYNTPRKFIDRDMKNYTLDDYKKDIKKLKQFDINLLWDKSFWGLSVSDSITAVASDPYSKLKQLLNNPDIKEFEYKGCVMLGLNPVDVSWKDILSKIDAKDLYEEEGEQFGLEEEPHITLLYGLKPSARAEVLNYYKENFPSVKIVGTKISLFENEKFDVLKFDIDASKKLLKLNKHLTDNFSYKNDHPDYHPHCTIAYLKKGEGKKYLDIAKTPLTFDVTELMWSEEVYKFKMSKSGDVKCVDRKTCSSVLIDDKYEVKKLAKGGVINDFEYTIGGL